MKSKFNRETRSITLFRSPMADMEEAARLPNTDHDIAFTLFLFYVI